MKSPPKQIKISQLEIQHIEYRDNAPLWRTIDTLVEGVPAIEKSIEKYLPKRPNEDDELYRMRLDKLSYTGVMSDAVHKFTSKLSGSPIHFTEVNSDDEFWSEFRHNNAPSNQPMRDESYLINTLFSNLLYYGKVWVAVDMPDTGLNPKSKFEEKQIGKRNMPYLTVYTALDVTYWGEEWAISKHYSVKSEPFEEPKLVCTWLFWGKDINASYSAEVKLASRTDAQNNNYEYIHEVKIGGLWMSPKDDAAIIPLKKVWEHGAGHRLLCTLKLPKESWLCKHVFNKQIQHLRIENSWIDAGYLSGTVQRLFTPPDLPPVDDPRFIYEQPDYTKELGLAGNQHILIGNGYAFVESEGKALGNLEAQLDKLESQIRQLVALHFATGEKGAIEQSGASKAMDMTMLEDAMRNYGKRVMSLYNDILKLTAIVAGVEEPIAIGLESYSAETVEDLLATIMNLETLPKFPHTAKKITYGKLAKLLVGTISPGDGKQINDELEKLFDNEDANVGGLSPQATDEYEEETLDTSELSENARKFLGV